jgi:hypothetical protein
MRKFIFLFLITLITFCSNISSKTTNGPVNINLLIESLITIESNGIENAVSKDSNCVGVLQIKKIIVDDCNEYLLSKGIKKQFNYNDRYNKEKSIEMFHLIQERYRNYKTHRSKTHLEHMIRLWNGGCGYNIKSTQDYYNKVMVVYAKKVR